ncbi:hypothetical protein CcaverHIS002_0101530 [Cutaneotrichosporon cavernicola]|uniref:Ricin B lectin domain-containing protein n=1 Tax=Cutaneotrichosporon cavernicola TaxID=279322 RepID=A0AA48I102_9TREE|nr:uncharacterized protein CcaverHIS019_0101500 [Cutaneotrichosporon cavernicola]BEI79624.1 hypothetical protein CcaverHIS002_0101530 [Cutaneotrichosporon cavernicola]BEI87432.1 hypothetical protein CcaverHIS019_0101500 [Cutaneotrichosporon cavernicola]BEI95201.1 hypothetical protein CcaverHIS631_0101500 [Cutaneotrichosporon cavernicola]BEJ02974.1 hypothetical protein CcaverHIS641_0101490 [Cutaneotrichosporon cavernicola]
MIASYALAALLPLVSAKWAAYTISPAAFPDLCVVSNGTANGDNLVLGKCEGASSIWKYSDVNGKIKNGKQCMDVRDGVEIDGTLAQTWDCAVCNDHQSFDFISPSNNSIFQVQWTYADYCLDLHEGKGVEGATIQIWKCLEFNDNQKWIVGAVNATAAPAPSTGANATASANATEEADTKARRAHQKRRTAH